MLTKLIPKQVNVLSDDKYVIYCRGSMIRNKMYFMTIELATKMTEPDIILIRRNIHTNIPVEFS